MRRWASSSAPREAVECVVVGAGVVGMAIARQLSLDGRNVIVVEAASAVGTGISSRNSQVIHAGIYYPVGSLKAHLCVQGNKALYSYCQDRQIPHAKIGKLIVATAAQQVQTLQKLQQTGAANGADSLQMLTAAEALQMEPELRCVKALWSPSTGIVDTHALILSLQADAEDKGVVFALNTMASGGNYDSAAGEIDVYVHQARRMDMDNNTIEMVLAAKVVINAAGLHATAVAMRIRGVRPNSIPTSYFAKGNYFAIPSSSAKPPFSRLIYPVPEEGGLGVHLTIDLGGGTRFGPDVEWLPHTTSADVINQFDYSVDPARASSFYSEIRKYYPALVDGCLSPDYCGIRPKLCGPGKTADFMIQGEEGHGVPGLINLFGIESPGLTACLEIAKRVGRMVSLGLSKRREEA